MGLWPGCDADAVVTVTLDRAESDGVGPGGLAVEEIKLGTERGGTPGSEPMAAEEGEEERRAPRAEAKE